MSQRKINNIITINSNPKARTEYDEDIEDISFYHYSKFENVNLINKNIKNVCKAHIKKIVSQQERTIVEVVALKSISLNDKFTLKNFINEVKRHRKLEINDNILKFYGITKQENANNYMIVLEYANNGSLRQYLKTNFQKLDWSIKLNLAKQIAIALMNLHDNNIIHGKLTSENILVHNGNIKLNDFGINYIKSLTTIINTPIQYTDFRYLELFNKSLDIYSLGIILWEISNDGISPFEKELITKSSTSTNNDFIVKIKREKSLPGIPPKYNEIYTDCLNHHRNSRPDIFEIVNDLSEININTKNKLEKSNEEKIPKTYNYNIIFIKKLFEFFINCYKTQSTGIRSTLIKNYVREHNLNPVKILHKMIRYPSQYWFTSLIGFFYQHGIGTVVDNQMAFKLFNLAANEIIDTSNFSLRKLSAINKEIGIISLADMYFEGLGVEKDTKKAFQIYSKASDEGSLKALNAVAYCYDNGFGVKKNEEKAFETYLKSAEKGNSIAQFNVGDTYIRGAGIKKDEAKGLQWTIKSALAGNVDAICNVGYYYYNCRRIDKEGFKWYVKAAEKESFEAQFHVGWRYYYGEGIGWDYKKGFKWFKKAAENDHFYGQYFLGNMLYEGYFIKKDIVKAIYWLNKAKDEITNAYELLEEIISQMIHYVNHCNSTFSLLEYVIVYSLIKVLFAESVENNLNNKNNYNNNDASEGDNDCNELTRQIQEFMNKEFQYYQMDLPTGLSLNIDQLKLLKGKVKMIIR
ncbi:hypothetical protein Glove_164g69 [Diversispora epigaea]|uniref:Protein kinase domain-containing protein n=1 Tax=Diversispora epigaea TaxID=1348612 RepID=A0A397J020_9GLOM|nr:hypothetical protein Glove_164g69 [Diversispora epigaea]